MKSISFSFYLAVLSLPMVLFGQDLQTKEAVSTQHWYSFPSPLNGDPLLVLYQSWPDLPDGPEESFELLKVRKDALGQEHQLFQWIHAGYPVEWAEIRLHGTAEGWQMVNGFVPKIEFPPSAIKLSEDQARQKAIQEVDAEVYFWENSSNDRLIQSATQGKKTSFFPDAQLMWVDEDHDWQTNAYRLAYRFDIFAQEPMGTYRVYVDAQTGTILKQTDLTHEMEVEGQAHTRHNGVRSIQTDSVAADSFRLREYGRAAAGIETYDLNNSTDLSTAVDFTDSDNVWNNANAQWDEVATDVHWGMEMTYDYFLQEHGWDSYDGNGGKLLSFVHWDVPGSPTAFWNVYFAGFADNNGNPHVGLDVIGHEVMHGVVRNSCDLIYIDEGGALNEGLADIFGNLIQWHTTPDDFSWEVGENSSPFRDMSDPNRFGHPDTYQGTNWYEGDADNGGTHINNNVLGYWFYVLAVGDTSTNDFGNDFELSGIGMETVADIVFRAMSTYWTPTTQFEDARRGTIQAALDLFGTCSPEVNAVRNAWYAVGLGDKVQNMDVGISRILPEEDCKFVADRYITVELTNYGCLPIPGNLINVVVDVPSIGAVVIEPANVDTLAGGESIEMMLATPISMPLVGDYEIRARALLGGDPNASNNAAENEWLFRRETVIGGSTISFQPAFIPFEDLLWWESGESSQVSVLPGVGKDSTMGLQITGGNGFEYRFVESFPLWGGPDPDVFDFNPEFESKVCFCLAEQHYAPGWLEFDLKQQYSEYFLPRFTNPQLNLPNPDSSLAIASSSLRVTVNGEEIARFSPQSPSADTFQRHVIPLSGDTLYPYLFSDLQVCLKSRTVWSPDQALDGIGDFIFLDNIRMEGMPISIEEKLLENRWHIFPNPTTGSFSIQSNQLHSSPVQFKVLNPMGQEVWQQQMDRTLADVPISVELGQQLSRGIYFLQIIQADHQETHQLVLR